MTADLSQASVFILLVFHPSVENWMSLWCEARTLNHRQLLSARIINLRLVLTNPGVLKAGVMSLM